MLAAFAVGAFAAKDRIERGLLVLAVGWLLLTAVNRSRAGLEFSPFYRIDPQQKSILLLALYAGLVLIFFSLSTNQEYYTFPAYLPLMLLIAATITRAEQTFATDPAARRWISTAHAALTVVGGLVAIALAYGLIASWRLPFVPDIGDLLAHRGVGDYTLSTSHLFDLTANSFAGLRLPALLAAIAFLLGPSLAWLLRAQRRHIAATTAIGLTAGMFLVAAHIALGRFGPMLSSASLAGTIQTLEEQRRISEHSQVLLYGDQAYGSSIPFYLGQRVDLVNGRSTSMWFGSTFPDAPHIFLSGNELLAGWGSGERKILFVPLEKRDEVDALLHGRYALVLREMSGKALLTDRALDLP